MKIKKQIFYKIMESTMTLLNLIQRYLIKKTKNTKQQISNIQMKLKVHRIKVDIKICLRCILDFL